eukprot:3169203-Pyramimonas_sp.AAC.1
MKFGSCVLFNRSFIRRVLESALHSPRRSKLQRQSDRADRQPATIFALRAPQSDSFAPSRGHPGARRRDLAGGHVTQTAKRETQLPPNSIDGRQRGSCLAVNPSL